MHPTPLYRRNTKLTSAHGYLPAIALMLVGMVIVTKVLLLGLFLLLMAISTLTLGEGVEIDFQQNRIRIFLGLFGLRFGKWEALPLMERITLVEVEQKQLLASRVHPTAEVSVACAQVRLYAQGSLEILPGISGQLCLSVSRCAVTSPML